MNSSVTSDVVVGDNTHVHDAVQTLRAALKSEDPAKAAIAIDGIRSMFQVVNGEQAARALRLLQEDDSLPHPTRVYKQNLVRALLPRLLESHNSTYALMLMDLNVPEWMQGGLDFHSCAVTLDEIAPIALQYIDSGPIDFNTLGAVLIGMYGPDAAKYLPDLLQRLERDWQDCSRAPGLAWAIYMIGGTRPAVREWLVKLATDSRACPHAKETAIRILEMNEISLV